MNEKLRLFEAAQTTVVTAYDVLRVFLPEMKRRMIFKNGKLISVDIPKDQQIERINGITQQLNDHTVRTKARR